jgi:serine/threonine-protein kinase
MPDLVGESVERAESQLAPYNVRITKVSRIAPSAPGLVLTQEPAAGSAFPTSAKLTVSVAPPTVPDVTNTTFGNAERQLQDLGFEVVEVPLFDDKLLDGVVVKQDPAAGAKNAGQVTLQVARRPAVKYLSDLEPVDKDHYGSFDTGTQKSNSISYAHGIFLSLYQGINATVDYDLSRQYRQLIGSVGLNDKAATNSAVKLEVYGDDRLLKEFTLTFGTTTELDVDVTKVLRLRLSISLLRGNGGVVLGDARLQGLPSEVGSGASASPTPSVVR